MRISDWSSDVCSSDLADKRLGRIGKTLGDILPELDAPVGDPAADLFEKLGALMPEFADDEPAHCHAAGQHGAERRGAEMRLLRRGKTLILRDESANRQARETVSIGCASCRERECHAG